MRNLSIVNNMAKTFWSAIYSQSIAMQLPEQFANSPIIRGPSPLNGQQDRRKLAGGGQVEQILVG